MFTYAIYKLRNPYIKAFHYELVMLCDIVIAVAIIAWILP